MREPYLAIGKRLRQAREGLGLSQQEVGNLIGLSDVGYGAFERGDRQISIEHLLRLSVILGQSAAWFLGLDGQLTEREDHLLTTFRSITSPVFQEQALEVVKAVADADRRIWEEC